MLEGRISKKRGDFTVDIGFRCVEGRLLGLTGSSGAGKTTIIRMIAGLEQPDSGWIANNGITWFDSGKKIAVPVRKRKVGYVFQEQSLFPHLTVAGNVGYSCRDKTKIRELLSMLGILHLAERKPSHISGGERQRVAIAQALASSPEVLLLDEPFSALDAATRGRLRRELKYLKELLHIPVIMVTHDLEEARFLADEIVNLPYHEYMRDICPADSPFLCPDVSFFPAN